MGKNSKLFVFLPTRPCFLAIKEHYHEINEQRMIYLLDYVGLRILSTEEIRTKRPFYKYLLGVKPFLRLIYDYIIVYEIGKNV